MIKPKYVGPLYAKLLARGGDINTPLPVAKVLAGTTLTQGMIDQMIEASLRGEAIHTWFDGDAVRVETKEIREIGGIKFVTDESIPPDELHIRQGGKLVGKIVNLAHEDGREVPNMGATDQPTRTTTTNIEPSAASAKPGESS